MQPDPARVDEARAWFARAQSDLRASAVDRQAEPPLLHDALFHCQQAVEKAMKGFLTWHDRVFRKTHSLVELGVQCSEIDASLEPLLQRTAPLTQYATAYRYPGIDTEPTADEAESSEALAREAVEKLFSALPVP